MLKPFILVADIGGSHISSTVIDKNNWEIIDEKIHKSAVDGFADRAVILDTWSKNLKESMATYEVEKIQKIVIALPGPFDYEKGVFQKHPEGKFGSLVGLDIKSAIQENIGTSIEILFENDAAAFGIGESYFGQSRNYKNSIAITLGTGIGATFIAHHCAIKEGENVPKDGELYHQKFQESIADDYFSTRWFVKKACDDYNLKVDGVKELLELGNPTIVKTIFDSFAQSFYQFLLPYALNFKAEAIVIGGNIAKAWSYFGDTLAQLFQAQNIAIYPSILQEKSTLLGAAKAFDTTLPIARFDFNKTYVLEDERVRLTPLKSENINDLLAISEETDLWTYFLEKGNGLENLTQYIKEAINNRNDNKEYPFVVFDKLQQKYAGTTRLYAFSDDFKTVKLGHTWYGKDFQGTGLNKHCKYLLFQFIFEQFGMERIGFGAYKDNIISVAAMKSVGCKEEGILRNIFPALDGKGRADGIILSILKEEWFNEAKPKLAAKIYR